MELEKTLSQAIDYLCDGNQHKANLLMEQCHTELIDLKQNHKMSSEHWLLWGTLLELQEEWEQAILKYESALNTDPDLAEAWIKICKILFYQLEKPELAHKLLKEKLHPLLGEKHSDLFELTQDLNSVLKQRTKRQPAQSTSTLSDSEEQENL